jgi:peptide/nickel transport system substrate-binding protein
MKWRIWLIATFCLAGLACSGEKPKDQFVVAIESYPSSLDPRYPTDAYSSKVQGLLFNGLLKFDEKLQLVPDLAEGYEFVDPLRLHIQLRKGVHFHNGKELTARDVAYTYESIRQAGSHSPLSGTFEKISEIKVLGPYELELTLKEPFAPILTALTVGIVPEGASNHPIGTGPFRFSGLKKDQWVQLEANPDYFPSPPLLPKVEFLTVRDDTTRVLQTLRGDVDLVQNAIPLVMAAWLKDRARLEMKTDQGINYAYLAFNLKDPLLTKRQVREAIAMALNRDELIQTLLKGFARPATGILAPSNWYYEPEIPEMAFDPELAKKLLDDAGYPDPDGDGPLKRFTLTYKTSNRRDRILMARAIARQLEAVGIGVTIRPYEWGTFYRDIRTGNFQIFTSTWVGVTDPDIYYYVFHSQMVPPNGANRGFYQNSIVDGLLDLARKETNPELRKKYYSQVQKLVALELPYVSLWYEDNVAFMQPDVTGYELRPDGSFIGLVNTKKANLESRISNLAR